MKAGRDQKSSLAVAGSQLQKSCCLLVLGFLFYFPGLTVRATPLISTESPTTFFTNVASWLLRSELGLNPNRIQLYPTNQYTPAVHRLLQVTANIYDAVSDRSLGFQNPPSSSPPTFPVVFRPLFESANA